MKYTFVQGKKNNLSLLSLVKLCNSRFPISTLPHILNHNFLPTRWTDIFTNIAKSAVSQ